MSIKPTKDQVRTVWDETPAASSRSVAEIMKAQGFDISFRTVARWHAIGWSEDGPNTPVTEKVHRRLKDEISKVQADAVHAVDAEVKGALEASGGLKDADYARIEKLVQDLGDKDLSDLKAMQEKERTIMNIVMMREATRRAHVMTLIPKDTSAMIAAFTDDAKTVAPPLGPIAEAPKGPAVIEGEFKVVSQTTAALQRFLAKESAA